MCHAVQCRLTLALVFPVEAAADGSECVWPAAGEKWSESADGKTSERVDVCAAAADELKQVAITGLKWRAALSPKTMPRRVMAHLLLFCYSSRAPACHNTRLITSAVRICAQLAATECVCEWESEWRECTASRAHTWNQTRYSLISASCFPGIRAKIFKSSETLENFNWKTDLMLFFKKNC